MHNHEHEHHHNHDHGCSCGHDHDCGCGHDHSHEEGAWKELILPTIGAIICFVAYFLIPDSLGSIDSHISTDSPITLTAIIRWSVFAIGFIMLSFRIVISSIKGIFRGRIFDENFLMTLAAVGALVTGEYTEGVAVMFLFQFGEFLQDLATDRSRKDIEKAMDLKIETAVLASGNDVKEISSEDVKPGDILLVRSGEKIPVDGIVVEGNSFIDTSSLTGESVPVSVEPGKDVLSGCINTGAPFKIKALKSYDNSAAARILELVENAADKKSRAENFITGFARIYTPIVVAAAVLLAVVPPVIRGLFLGGGYDFMTWIYRACGFLVVSCPCALVISVPLGFFSALGSSSAIGVVVKGSNYMSELNKIDTVVFDKTGTLTKGEFKVTEIVPSDYLRANSDSASDLLLTAAASLERISSHPVAVSVLEAYNNMASSAGEEDAHSHADFPDKINDTFREIPGRGICGDITVNGKLTTVYAGNEALMKDFGLSYEKPSEKGVRTIVYVASDAQYFGYIRISDEIREDAVRTVSSLKEKGYDVIMLTGDRAESAAITAAALGIDTYYAELLPQDKVSKIEALKKAGKNVLFVGDGINDAPVLAISDVGCAMGAIGSDAAIEAADVVIMNDEPSKLARAFAIAAYANRVVKENIWFSIGVKLIILVIMAIGVGNLWIAIFADVGVALIAILNSLRILRSSPN